MTYPERLLALSFLFSSLLLSACDIEEENTFTYEYFNHTVIITNDQTGQEYWNANGDKQLLATDNARNDILNHPRVKFDIPSNFDPFKWSPSLEELEKYLTSSSRKICMIDLESLAHCCTSYDEQ